MNFFLLFSTIEDIWKNDGKQWEVAIDFHSMEKNTMEVIGYQQQINILQMKETGFVQHESE